MSTQQPVAIVTGANRGIGKEVSRQLALKGYIVLLTARSLQNAERTAQELGSDNLRPAQLNVTDSQSIDSLYERTLSEFNRLDVLVNNAAINYDTWQKAIDADLDMVRETFETNVFGAWRLCQTLLPLLGSVRDTCNFRTFHENASKLQV